MRRINFGTENEFNFDDDLGSGSRFRLKSKYQSYLDSLVEISQSS